MKIKWNWGTKIATFYITFVAFIIFMVYSSFSENYDLVTEDYYAQEIKYQQTIDSRNRANEMSQNLQVAIDGNQLLVLFPKEGDKIKGTLMAFRPSDEKKDFREQLNVKHGKHVIPLNRFSRGKYRLKIEWTFDELRFYNEQIIVIP